MTMLRNLAGRILFLKPKFEDNNQDFHVASICEHSMQRRPLLPAFNAFHESDRLELLFSVLNDHGQDRTYTLGTKRARDEGIVRTQVVRACYTILIVGTVGMIHMQKICLERPRNLIPPFPAGFQM